ncbi:thiamine phosphate synthase, partial [Brevundimonas sp.]|uniref:thiamine phosphate synthase n=1 Tax=Brevundimonas sp. TaxID=1871086 RepID=UPI001A2267B7
MILSAGYSDDARMIWDAATALNRAAAAVSPAAARLPPLLFFTDPARTPRPWETAARLPPGSAVVYRAFGADHALEIGHRLRAVTREAGVELLVGKDADLADAVSADGLHLPEREADR